MAEVPPEYAKLLELGAVPVHGRNLTLLGWRVPPDKRFLNDPAAQRWLRERKASEAPPEAAPAS